MKTEHVTQSFNGYLFLTISLLIFFSGLGIILFTEIRWLGVVLVVLDSLFLFPGFFLVNPNESKVLLLFGEYKGTVKDNGFFWANPFYHKKRISLRAQNFDSERIKVNDKKGNPIMISGIVVWRVKDTYKAAFDVTDYHSFVKVQSEAALRELAGSYAYDNMDDEGHEMTLRSGHDEVNHALETQLRARLAIAGIEVIEARIGYLAYAPEIASAMLRRQQAEAVVAARMKIVEGAVGMVEQALLHLSKKAIIELDEEKKAAMVSNLMVVLCSDKDATPIVNAGTLHQ
ncbi:MAG TPA: SPFH domain-containing protein [Saprospiraceae bacterium]|nr:SPFH domain-containing protein [Saprospiraceae bacterium]HNT22300.1 SPFH domain-containing protein [Saprospiraceae bacterium]